MEKTKKSFGQIWAELTSEQTEYLKDYINRQRQDAVKEYKTQQLRLHGVVCCGVLEKMNLGWMKLEDGTKCMPYIKGHSDEVMYRVNNCPSCGKYVRDVMI